MKFKPGDKVEATETGLEVPVGTKGKVVGVFSLQHKEPTYPYDVLFKGIPFKMLVAEEEIRELRNPWVRFLDRVFPKRDAEKDFGSEETVEAFRNVQKHGEKVTLEGK